MSRLRVGQLQVGQRFDHDLRSDRGQLIMRAGTPLSDRMLAVIRRGGISEVVVDEPSAIVESGGGVGATHRGDAVDVAGHQREREPDVPVGSAGDGIGGGVVDDAASIGRLLEAGASDAICRVGLSKSARLGDPSDPHAWPDLSQLTVFRDEAVKRVGQQFEQLGSTRSCRLEEINTLVGGLIMRLTQFPTRVAQLATLVPHQERYLPEHGFTVAVLAMSIAGRLGWSATDVWDVGLTGLLADVGMLAVPRAIREAPRSLTDAEIDVVHQHPEESVLRLAAVDLPLRVKLGMLQHHEREDGSGYPRGLKGGEICDYGRVVAVADTYAAITEPRAYRQSKLPYLAIEETLRAAGKHRFWKPAVRALIEAAGLFPVGSWVTLSDGRVAEVMAANPGRLDRPVVQPFDQRGRSVGDWLDLDAPESEGLSVVRPADDPTHAPVAGRVVTDTAPVVAVSGARQTG